MASEWSRLTPPSGIREIEQQRGRVLDLRAQVTGAVRSVTPPPPLWSRPERADRERMAKAMSSGRSVAPDLERVEKAKAHAAGAVRAAEALDLAIAERAQLQRRAQASRGLGQGGRARSHRVPTKARESLAAFRVAVGRYRDAQQVELWLRDRVGGLDREQAPRSGVLGYAPGSGSIAANRSDVDLGTVFSWLAAAIEPPPPLRAVESQPLTPVQQPGAFVR